MSFSRISRPWLIAVAPVPLCCWMPKRKPMRSSDFGPVEVPAVKMGEDVRCKKNKLEGVQGNKVFIGSWNNM